MGISTTMFIGRLTKDPEVSTRKVKGEDVAFAKFTVAVDDFMGDPDFYNVVVWRKQAENVGKYLAKGREVGVTGRMKVSSYNKNVNGTDVFIPTLEVRATDIQFIGGRGDGGQGGQQQSQQPARQTQPASGPVPGGNGGGSPWDIKDDDLPF